MMSPTRSREERELGDAIDMAGINGDLAGEFAAPSVARPKLRLNPTTGRTVLIGGTTDLAYGFKMLDIGVNQNRVKRDFQQQRFHERGGLKRKRLGRERWRKRFGEGFKAVVGRVKYLRKQGW
jgi:small subunit ribosomal protein MRP21